MTTELPERSELPERTDLLKRGRPLPDTSALAPSVRGLLVAQAMQGVKMVERRAQLHELARQLLPGEPLAACQAFEASFACHLDAGIVDSWAFCETLKIIGRFRRRLPPAGYCQLIQKAMAVYGLSLSEERYYSRDWGTIDILISRVLALPPSEMVECALRFHDRRPARSVWRRVQARLQDCDTEEVMAALSAHIDTLPSIANAAHSEQAAFLSRCLASLPPGRAVPLYGRLFQAVAWLRASAPLPIWYRSAFVAVIDHLPIAALTPEEGMTVLEAGLDAVSTLARTQACPAQADNLSRLLIAVLHFGPRLGSAGKARLCAFFHAAVTQFRGFESAERVTMCDLPAHTIGQMPSRPSVSLYELMINAALKERSEADSVLALLNLLDRITPSHYTYAVKDRGSLLKTKE